MTMKPPLKKGTIQRGLKPSFAQSPVSEEELEKDDSILETVERQLIQEGITPFDNANIMEEYLKLPADLTECDSKDLGRYFNAFTKQKLWCRTLLARTSALLRELTEELDSISDKVYSELPPKMSVTEKKLKLRSHEKYGERATELLKDVALYQERQNMLATYLDNLVDCIVCISREITRREGDFFDERRENSIEKKRTNRQDYR
jgi:hypothetical protein